MADKDSQQQKEVTASAPTLNLSSPQDNIKSASSNWLVEDLTPATMIMVDDSPTGMLL
jgi:hypothetical protein